MRLREKRTLAAAVALAVSGLSSIVHAGGVQGPDKTATTSHRPTYETDAVVVTASGFEEDPRFAPASITVIKSDEIMRRGYTDLRQVLDTIEGIDTFGATGRFDTPAVSIRGMSDAHTLILVDGVA